MGVSGWCVAILRNVSLVCDERGSVGSGGDVPGCGPSMVGSNGCNVGVASHSITVGDSFSSYESLMFTGWCVRGLMQK